MYRTRLKDLSRHRNFAGVAVSPSLTAEVIGKIIQPRNGRKPTDELRGLEADLDTTAARALPRALPRSSARVIRTWRGSDRQLMSTLINRKMMIVKMLVAGEIAREIVLLDPAGALWRLSEQVVACPVALLFYRAIGDLSVSAS